MKIKAKNPNVASMELIVPVDGRITIDGKGVADVSPKCAAVLVKHTNDWEYVKAAKGVADETDDEEEDDEKSERELLEEKLKTMKLEEMKEMAEQGEFPQEEWGKLTSKKLMAAYLLKKYDEAAEEGGDETDDEEEDDEK